MWSRMGPREVLKVRLETGIIAREGVDGVIHIRLGEGRVDQRLRIYGWCAWDVDYAEEGLEGVITADVVGNGVGDSDILEATGEDLIVVRRVTPRPKTLGGVVRQYRRVVEVCGV